MPEAVSLLLMLGGMLLTHIGWFSRISVWTGCSDAVVMALYYFVALMPVGYGITKSSWEAWHKGDIFNEFTLMALACVGAFIIGEYPEGVAILLFYSFGEKLEESASDNARSRIRSLLGSMPQDIVRRLPSGSLETVPPEAVVPGDKVVVKPGQRVAVDGILCEPSYARFDTSAITGESVPVDTTSGEAVSSGAIPVDKEVEITVTRPYSHSTMSRIMRMIEDAADNKSHSETLLRKITRWYTPAVMIAAVLLFAVPWFVSVVSGSYSFDWHEWLYRSLVLMVCSCPCALVVSIPLSYFAAVGNASRFGVLFKGSRYLDLLRGIDTVYLDKTGTLTTGQFSVSDIVPADGYEVEDVLSLAAALDAGSSHPLAQAIVKMSRNIPLASDVVTVPHGMRGVIDGKLVLVGSATLLIGNGVKIPSALSGASRVCVAVDGCYAGSIYLEDMLKEAAVDTVTALHKLGIKRVVILSGDTDEAVRRAAEAVGADDYKARLLPEDKYRLVCDAAASGHKVAFIGDGINDAPSLAAATVGIAIGTGGTDVAMESADAVITGNSLIHLVDAVGLSYSIRRVVAQNVSLALGVKGLVMVLGAFGLASLWAAVFADTGITLVTVAWTLICLRIRK
jgi:cadmium-exporting ATPase